ncbi:hypothetical protein GCM10010403_48980 [Glycomyces rutgersensis]|uniref:Uncharacterized protein n=1 Tax=Glycomyces rutgersensis TaxID=58115 RepID=A0ABP5TBQ7_9ACTN
MRTIAYVGTGRFDIGISGYLEPQNRPPWDARSAAFLCGADEIARTRGTFTNAGREWNNIRTNIISTGHGG